MRTSSFRQKKKSQYIDNEILLSPPSRESEGSFQYGNYRREAEDLRAVVQHFRRENRVISAVIGHSKGLFASLLSLCRMKEPKKK